VEIIRARVTTADRTGGDGGAHPRWPSRSRLASTWSRRCRSCGGFVRGSAIESKSGGPQASTGSAKLPRLIKSDFAGWADSVSHLGAGRALMLQPSWSRSRTVAVAAACNLRGTITGRDLSMPSRRPGIWRRAARSAHGEPLDDAFTQRPARGADSRERPGAPVSSPTTLTPEITRRVLDYELPGNREATGAKVLEKVPTATLGAGRSASQAEHDRQHLRVQRGSEGRTRGPVVCPSSATRWEQLVRGAITSRAAGV